MQYYSRLLYIIVHQYVCGCPGPDRGSFQGFCKLSFRGGAAWGALTLLDSRPIKLRLNWRKYEIWGETRYKVCISSILSFGDDWPSLVLTEDYWDNIHKLGFKSLHLFNPVIPEVPSLSNVNLSNHSRLFSISGPQ